MKKMRIRIGRDGKTTMRVEGAVGEECLDFTKAFEQALGNVEKRVMSDSDESVREQVQEHERADPAS